MNTYSNQTQDNKSQSKTSKVAQEKSSDKNPFQFVDNRPEAIAQRKMQILANNSPQTKKAVQFKTIANNSNTSRLLPIQKLASKKLEGAPQNNLNQIKTDKVAQRFHMYESAQWQDEVWGKYLFAQRVQDKKATTGQHNYAMDMETKTVMRSGTSGHAEILLLSMSGEPRGGHVTIISEYKPCKYCQAQIKKIEQSRDIEVLVVYFLDYEEKGDGDTEVTRDFYKDLGWLEGGGQYNYRVKDGWNEEG